MNDEPLHAHEVLRMMEGRSYTENSLKKAIAERFGAGRRFYACSESGMSIDRLIDFLKEKGKFKPMNDGFTVDLSKMCNHS
ncbi:MAG: YecH family metal-binding protein [Alistipes sp.]